MKKRILGMIVTLCMVLSVFSSIPMTASAATSGTCGVDNVLTWSLDDNGTLTISGNGLMENVYHAYLPWHAYRSKIKTVEILDGVLNIGDGSFYDCANLVDVYIPESVKGIGRIAFMNCTSLQEIKLPKNISQIGETAFNNTGYYNDSSNWENGVLYIGNYLIETKSLSGKYAIKDGTTHIANHAFWYASDRLTEVTFPKTLKSIGNGSFTNCNGLTEVIFPDGVERIGTSFSCCSNLERVYFGSGLKDITGNAFSSCPKLSKIEVSKNNPQYYSSNNFLIETGTNTLVLGYRNENPTIPIGMGITKIGEYAFVDSKLTNVIIPSGVTTICDRAFSCCWSLEKISLPNSITNIEEYAFQNCRELKDIYYSGTQNQWKKISIGSDNNYLTNATIHYDYSYAETMASGTCGDNLTWVLDSSGTLTISGSGNMTDWSVTSFEPNMPWSSNDDKIKNVVIENNVKSIGEVAFYGCNNLTSITIPNSVTSIGGWAFYGCNRLISVTIPNSVTSIGKCAFLYCRSLTSVTIPNGVTSIGWHSFSSCDNLTSINIPNSVKTIEAYAFSDSYSITDVYYDGTKEEWKKISIGSSGNNYLTNATIHYNYAKPNHSISTSSSAPIIKSAKTIHNGKSYNILNEKLTINKGTTARYDIKLDIDWNSVSSSNRDVYLTQGLDTELKGNAFIQYNALTDAFEHVSLGTQFVASKPIYIVAVDKSNPKKKSSSIVTKLNIIDLSSDDVYQDSATGDFNFKLGKDTEIELPDDVPIIGGMKLSWKMSPIPITVAYKSADTMSVAIGCNVVTENEDGIKKFKDFDFDKYKKSIVNAGKKQNRTLKQLRHDFRLSNDIKVSMFDNKILSGGSGDVDSGVDVLGYAEVKRGENGKWKFDEATGYIKVDVSVEYKYNGQVFVWVIPCYYEIGGELSAGLEADIESLDKASYAPQLTAYLNAALGINLGAGIGVSKVATFGATGSGTLNLKKGLSDVLEDYIRIWLEADAGYKLAVFGKTIVSDDLWELSADKGIIYSTDPEDEGKTWIKSEPIRLMSLEKAFNEYNVNAVYENESRDYSSTPTEWLGDSPAINLMAANYTNKELNTLATDIYTEAQPQIFEASGKKILIYTADNEERTAINKQMLVYSVYDEAAGVWSKPLPVADDGTSDFYPQAYGNYVVWQNQNVVMDDTYTLADMGKAGEICVVKWNGTGFDTPQAITSNDELDGFPKISENNGEINIVWLKNTDNDILGISGANSIVKKTFDGTAWSGEIVVADNLKIVTDLQVGYSGDDLYISYIEDADNDISTIDDREIFVIGNAKEQITNNEVLDSNIVISNGKLYWYESGNIYYKNLSGNQVSTVFADSKQELAEGFSVSESDGNTSILWSSAIENGAEIKGVLCQDGEWGDIIDVSALGGYSKYPTCVLTENGTILSAFTCEIDGSTALCTIDMIPSYNMTIDNVGFDESNLLLGANNEITVTVTNNGELPVSDYEIVVYNEDGSINKTTSYTDTIKAGETKEVVASFVTGESISLETLSVKIVINDGEEYDYTDNAFSLTIGNSNISIDNIANMELLPNSSAVATISNNGYSDATVITVSFRKNSEDGEVVSTETIDVLSAGESTEITFNYKPTDFDNTKWFITAETDAEESTYGDNADYFVNECALNLDEYENKILTYSITDNTLSINTYFQNNESDTLNATMYFAAYSKDNRLKGLDTQTISLNPYTDTGADGWITNYTFEDGDYVKVMVWKDNLCPVCVFDKVVLTR